MSPQSVSHVIESGFFGTLKHRDDKGRLIGFMRIRRFLTINFHENCENLVLTDWILYNH